MFANISSLKAILDVVFKLLTYPITIWGFTFNFLQVWVAFSLLAVLFYVMFKIWE